MYPICTDLSSFGRLCIISQIVHGTLGQMVLSAMNYLNNNLINTINI